MAKTMKTPQEILKEPYERALKPEEDGGFSACISEFEGCLASGETREEALQNLEEVAEAWIEAELERGNEIPPPWAAQEYSGKFVLRMPRGLHQKLARLAARERTSLNQYIVARLSSHSTEDEIKQLVTQSLDRARAHDTVWSSDDWSFYRAVSAATDRFVKNTRGSGGYLVIRSSGTCRLDTRSAESGRRVVASSDITGHSVTNAAADLTPAGKHDG